jgi:hypothetical protein
VEVSGSAGEHEASEHRQRSCRAQGIMLLRPLGHLSAAQDAEWNDACQTAPGGRDVRAYLISCRPRKECKVRSSVEVSRSAGEHEASEHRQRSCRAQGIRLLRPLGHLSAAQDAESKDGCQTAPRGSDVRAHLISCRPRKECKVRRSAQAGVHLENVRRGLPLP